MKKEVNIFNIKLHPYSKQEFLDIIETNLALGNKIVQNGVNASSINELLKDQNLKDAYYNSDLVNIDGMSMVWASRFMGHKIPERVACPDLAMDILKMAEKRKYSVFFLGTDQKNLELSIKKINKTYPNLIISGYRNGYFQEKNEKEIIGLINSSKTDILFLGMPSPKKEFFMEKNKEKLQIKYSLGVGGFFDILSGKTKRAPSCMQKNGFEWLYRFSQEPKRLWSRYMLGNIKFITFVLKEKFK